MIDEEGRTSIFNFIKQSNPVILFATIRPAGYTPGAGAYGRGGYGEGRKGPGGGGAASSRRLCKNKIRTSTSAESLSTTRDRL